MSRTAGRTATAPLTGALDLIEAAAGRTLDIAGVGVGEIGGIVMASTTGVATPSLDALLIERLASAAECAAPADLRPRLRRRCAGAGARRRPSLRRCLTRRCCSSSSNSAPCSSAATISRGQQHRATALFGDGAAAAVLRCDGKTDGTSGRRHRRAHLAAQPRHNGLGRRRGWAQGHLFPRYSAPGRGPSSGRVLGIFSAGTGWRWGDIGRFVCHPGGPKVIDAYETVFGVGFPGASEARRS